MNILGIETSCDETSLAIVSDGKYVISHEVFSQSELHAGYSGVVPELASRAHVEMLLPLYKKVLHESEHLFDGVAVTQGPGLSGSLMAGMGFAKGLSYALDLPLYAVDHIKAHAYAAQLEHELPYPFLVLIVSGGHTLLAIARDPLTLEPVTSTIDDACGEAFDKIADFLQLGYPGGPQLEQIAKAGDPHAYRFPTPFLKNKAGALSYSGLKTAVTLQHGKFLREGADESIANIAASFQHVACEAIVHASLQAASQLDFDKIVVCGGVASNQYLRDLFQRQKQGHLEVVFPSKELCTDNAAMVAGLAYWYEEEGLNAPYSVPVYSREQRYRSVVA